MPAAAADTAEEGWWDGSGSLAQSAPAVTEQGRCAVLGGGWFALLGPGSLSKSCGGVDGSLAGSPVGVGWVEGFDAEGSYVEVHLGDTTAACDTGGRRR